MVKIPVPRHGQAITPLASPRASHALPLCFALWVVLAVVLSLKSLPGWTGAFRQIYDAIGHASPFNYSALGQACLSHATALPYLTVILVCAYGAGWPLRRLLGIRAGPGYGMGFQLAAGWSVISLIQHGIGLAGLVFPILLKGQVCLLLLFGVLSAVAQKLWRGGKAPTPGARFPFALSVILFLVLVMLTQLPDTHEDARHKHFAAPEHYLLTHKIDAEPQHVGWHMPLGFEMVVLIPWALGGVVPAKLVNLGVMLTSFLLLFSLVGRLRPGSNAGWWACLWYIASGIVMNEVWQGKNDLMAAMYVTAAAWCGMEVVRKGRTRWWLALAWFLGAAAGVKYSTVFFLAALVVPLYFFCRSRVTWEWLAWGAVVGLIPLVGWFGASLFFLGNPFHPFLSGVFPELAWGPFYARGLHDFLRAISPPETYFARDWLRAAWRLLGDPSIGTPGLFALFPFVFLRVKNRSQETTYLMIAVVLAYVLWLPTERAVRYLAPMLPLVAAAVSVVEVEGRFWAGDWFRRGRLTLAGAVVVMALLNATHYLAPAGWRYLSGQITAGDLLQRQYTTWEDVRRWINGNLPVSARVLFTGETRRLWFAPRVISSMGVTEPIFWRLTLDSSSPEEVRKRVHQRGITHHLYNFVSGDYRNTLWFPGPEWSRRQLALYKKFIRRYYRRVYVSPTVDNKNGGFYIFEMRQTPSAKAEPVHYMPFTEGRFRRARQLVFRHGLMDHAWREAKRAAKGLEDVFQVQYALAKIAQERKDYESMFRLTAPGVRAGFLSDGNWTILGTAATMTGRHDLSIKAYVRAYQIYGQQNILPDGLAVAFAYRGLHWYQQKDYHKAWKDYQAALVWIPKEPSLCINAALTLAKLNRPDEALVYARRAVELAPENDGARKLVQRIEAHFKQSLR